MIKKTRALLRRPHVPHRGRLSAVPAKVGYRQLNRRTLSLIPAVGIRSDRRLQSPQRVAAHPERAIGSGPTGHIRRQPRTNDTRRNQPSDHGKCTGTCCSGDPPERSLVTRMRRVQRTKVAKASSLMAVGRCLRHAPRHAPPHLVPHGKPCRSKPYSKSSSGVLIPDASQAGAGPTCA